MFIKRVFYKLITTSRVVLNLYTFTNYTLSCAYFQIFILDKYFGKTRDHLA